MAKQVLSIGDTGATLVSKFNNNANDTYGAIPKIVNSSVTGSGSTDLSGTNNVIDATNSVTAGYNNHIEEFSERGLIPSAASAIGYGNRVYSQSGVGFGTGVLVDGLLGMASGNNCIASGNDSFAMGGTCVTGRHLFEPTGHGIDDLHGMGGGNKPYVIIDVAEGDMSELFPNEIVYDPSNPTSLVFALHPYCILKIGESSGLFYVIIKSEYSAETGTKVWYNNATDLGAGYVILSSYAPSIPTGIAGGNSMIAAGKGCNAVGPGAFAEGQGTKAWYTGSHAEGYSTKSTALGSHSEGESTVASGRASHAEGKSTIASGINAHAEGDSCVASGNYSHAMGTDAVASRPSQFAQGESVGKFSVVGDAQFTRDVIKLSAVGAGSQDMRLLVSAEYGKSYAAETLLVGKQSTETVGMIGESCGYKFKWFLDRGAKHEFATTDVDIDNDRITVGEKIKTNTKLLFSTTGTAPTGITLDYVMYAIYVDDTHIQLSLTSSGAAVNLSTTGSGIHSYCRFNLVAMAKELIGRSFVDDGDTVGDGLTTGIRAILHETYVNGGNIRIYTYGLANRTIRWVASTQYSEVQ